MTIFSRFPAWTCNGFIAGMMALCLCAGCTTTKSSNTARTAMEQMLISNAVDQALDKVDFTAFQGRAVFLDDKYIDCVDKNYLISSMRHRLLRSGSQVVDAADKAEIVLEPRSGAVGTNTSESFVGVPEIALPGMLTLPEVRLLTRSNQTGLAKIGMVAYDAKTNQVLGDGGVALAQSGDNNWYVMGVGPYQNGTVRQEVSTGTKAGTNRRPNKLPQTVAFQRLPGSGMPSGPQYAKTPAAPADGSSTVRLVSEEEPIDTQNRGSLPDWLK